MEAAGRFLPAFAGSSYPRANPADLVRQIFLGAWSSRQLCSNPDLQLLFVAAVLAVLAIARRRIDAAPRWASLVPAYAIGALAMFWTLERLGSLGS